MIKNWTLCYLAICFSFVRCMATATSSECDTFVWTKNEIHRISLESGQANRVYVHDELIHQVVPNSATSTLAVVSDRGISIIQREGDQEKERLYTKSNLMATGWKVKSTSWVGKKNDIVFVGSNKHRGGTEGSLVLLNTRSGVTEIIDMVESMGPQTVGYGLVVEDTDEIYLSFDHNVYICNTSENTLTEIGSGDWVFPIDESTIGFLRSNDDFSTSLMLFNSKTHSVSNLFRTFEIFPYPTYDKYSDSLLFRMCAQPNRKPCEVLVELNIKKGTLEEINIQIDGHVFYVCE